MFSGIRSQPNAILQDGAVVDGRSHGSDWIQRSWGPWFLSVEFPVQLLLSFFSW